VKGTCRSGAPQPWHCFPILPTPADALPLREYHVADGFLQYVSARRAGIPAIELLKSVGLENYAHKHPASISGGQQQCAAIARALANDPPTLIADEPTGNLDSKRPGMVIEIFEELVHKGKTILIVTHDITVARHASHMLILSDGELIDEQVERIFPDLRINPCSP